MKHRQIIICFILLLGLKGFAQSNYAVLMEESPVGAGEMKPGMGVHTFNVNETVILTTVARPGWHFVYWLGDVSDPTANQTMLAVDGPKIVIAVFERDEYELLGGSTAASSGPESLIRRTDSISSGGFSGGGGGRGGGGGGGGDDPTPEPVPEPQTLLIMTIGTYLSCRKKFLIDRHHQHRGLGPRYP